jgi:predicted PurR-regulated permease PerM
VSRADTVFYTRVFGLVAVSLLAVALFQILQPFVGPILWALLLAFMLDPVNRVMRRALGERRGIAALLLTLAATLLVVGPGAGLTVVFAQQAGELIGVLQNVAARYHIENAADLLRMPLLEDAVRWLSRFAPISAAQVQSWTVQGGQTLLRTLVGVSAVLLSGALGVVVNFILMLFLLFFFLRDGEEMAARAIRLVPMESERKDHLVRHLTAVTRAVVLGSLITAIVQGLLVGIALAIAGLPSPVVFGVLAAIASLVPLVGTALIWVPAAVVLLAQGHGGYALFVVLWGVLVVANADNFIRPVFISGRAQISTLPVFLGLMGGLSAFGAIGMVLGPVIVALVIALLGFVEQSRPAEAAPVPAGSTASPAPAPTPAGAGEPGVP